MFEGTGRRRQGRRDPPRRPRPSTRASTASSRSPRPRKRNGRSPTCGASGGTFPGSAASPSSTAPGTAACWSNGSRASPRSSTGCGPIREINDFEEQLADDGGIVVKFWLAISKEEQYRRFREREKIAFKRFKITPEDWRNRKKWDAYEAAVCDMVDRTSTEIAPWTLVEANDKLYARIKVLKTVCERIEEALGSR